MLLNLFQHDLITYDEKWNIYEAEWMEMQTQERIMGHEIQAGNGKTLKFMQDLEVVEFLKNFETFFAETSKQFELQLDKASIALKRRPSF
jgi:hypothetical protein